MEIVVWEVEWKRPQTVQGFLEHWVGMVETMELSKGIYEPQGNNTESGVKQTREVGMVAQAYDGNLSTTDHSMLKPEETT